MYTHRCIFWHWHFRAAGRGRTIRNLVEALAFLSPFDQLIAQSASGINHYMPAKTAKHPTIAILIFEGTKLLDATGPLQVFADAMRNGEPAYHVVLCSMTGGSIRTDAGISLQTRPLDDLKNREIDTFLVSGGDSALEFAKSEPVRFAITRATTGTRRIGSICTGAFVLAVCGFLYGRAATTHWAHCQDLAKRFPETDVKPDAIFIKDGPVWTSAGVTTGIDMALAMVEADLGKAEALRLARSLILYVKRPGGQGQFSSPLRHQIESLGPLGEIVQYIRANLTEHLTVKSLALEAGMSERTFVRRFESELGDSPARYIEILRVETACEAFCSGERSVKRVAAIAGFRAEERMRRAFQRTKGIAPSEYRDRFARYTD